MSINNLKELSDYIDLTAEEMNWREDEENTLPILISDNIIPLLTLEEIRRQFVPSDKERADKLGDLDPQREEDYERTSRLIHRYKNRAALLVTDRCFAYCRHCFRRRFTGSMTGPIKNEEIDSIAEYLKEHKEIREVLLTGGDMFTLSDNALDNLLSKLKTAREDIIYRLCTRCLLSNPDRFTDNLFAILKKHNHGAPFYLMTQFNHPAEITEKAIAKLDGFLKLGIPLMNQCVLLRGVNDDLETQVELCNKLLYNRIKPYYLFQGDLVKGTAHLRVPLSEGLELEKKMRIELSGLGMPQYTIDLPDGGGKVILTENYIKGLDGNIWTIQTPEGEVRHYPEDLR